METTIPKQELLIKLLSLTTSDNDAEALSALRKATALLNSAGWSWEKLIRGKITVVADPFASLSTPPSASRPAPPAQAPQPFGQTPKPFTHNAAPPKAGKPPLSVTTNQYSGHCYCCGIELIATAGFIFRPSEHVNAPYRWSVVCSKCNVSAIPGRYAATPIRNPRKRSLDQIV